MRVTPIIIIIVISTSSLFPWSSAKLCRGATGHEETRHASRDINLDPSINDRCANLQSRKHVVCCSERERENILTRFRRCFLAMRHEFVIPHQRVRLGETLSCKSTGHFLPYSTPRLARETHAGELGKGTRGTVSGSRDVP